MHIRWLVPAVLVLSLLGNAVLGFFWLGTLLDFGHYASDQQTSWRDLDAERAQLRAMRAHFCESDPAPARSALLSWEAATRPEVRRREPYAKDGLLWLRDLGIKLDADDRLVGVCSYMTWQYLDRPRGDALDDPGENCPLERLC
jgi:hypothetical protein